MFKKSVKAKTIELLTSFECGVYFTENLFEKLYKKFKKKYTHGIEISNAIFDEIILTSKPMNYATGE